MGNTDSVPVVSQVKSAVQAVCGDTDAALRTQGNFIRGCPVFSQVTSTVQWYQGDPEGAIETQVHCVKNLSNLIDGVPVVGHVKGLVHYACGDVSGGNSAMLAATRTTGVVACGIIGGGVLGGSLGAIAGGITGGATMDGITTGVDSAITGEFRPHGHIALGNLAVTGRLDAGTAFDWVMVPIFDGLAGRASSRVYQSMMTKRILTSAAQESVDSGAITLPEGETVSSLVEQLESAAMELQETMKNAEPGALGSKSVASVVIDQKGNQHVGYSYRLRRAANIDAFQGEVPSAAQILENRIPGRPANIRGLNMGEAQCAEIHGLHQHHQANGLAANPSRTITVVHDGTGIRAIARCGSCRRVGRYVNMGDVPTDVLNGTQITLDSGRVLNTAMELLQRLECDCEDDDPNFDSAELSLLDSGHHDHQD